MKNVPKHAWTWLTASGRRFSLALALAIVGLLLWSRLIMVSNMPRTAVADDEEGMTPAPLVSDKDASDPTQGRPEDDPKSAPHESSRDETSSVSNSSPETR